MDVIGVDLSPGRRDGCCLVQPILALCMAWPGPLAKAFYTCDTVFFNPVRYTTRRSPLRSGRDSGVLSNPADLVCRRFGGKPEQRVAWRTRDVPVEGRHACGISRRKIGMQSKSRGVGVAVAVVGLTTDLCVFGYQRFQDGGVDSGAEGAGRLSPRPGAQVSLSSVC